MLNRPSVVRLLSNPTPQISTYEWVPTNVKSMNRTNKLSSVPFYVPNDTERKYQFRLVLLRGVVKGETEEKDPIAVYVEYLPPSSDGQPMVNHPGTCTIAIWCVNRYAEEQERDLRKSQSEEGAVQNPLGEGLSKGAPHRYEETTFTFTASERMTGFKELVPYTDLDNEAMVDPNAFNAMTIRVQITTGVVSVAEVVAKTTDRWASSLWGSATSAFQALQTGIDAIKSQVMSTVEERSEGAGPAPKEAKPLPWEELPIPWQKAGRSLEEWEKLIANTIVEDEGTFLYGAERGLHPDEQVLMTQLGLNHRAIMNASTLFDFDRDVHEGLLTVEAIRKQRYNLVPKLVKDKVFWGNYMWKVAALSTAPKEEQILLIMSIVNAPPRVAAKTGKVRSPVEKAESIVVQYEKEAADLLKQSFEATELLDELLADQAEEVLLDTARKSCRVCTEKLSDLLSRLNNTTNDSELADEAVATLDVLKVTVTKTLAQLQEPRNPARLPTTADHNPSDAPIEMASDASTEKVDEKLDVNQTQTTQEAPPIQQVTQELEQLQAKDQVNDQPAEVTEKVDTQSIAIDANEGLAKDDQPPRTHTHSSSFDVVETAEAAVREEPVASPKPAAPSPTAGKTSTSASKAALDFLDDDFPELSASPSSATTKNKPVASTKQLVASPNTAKEGSVASGRKIEFEPMPWDEEDD